MGDARRGSASPMSPVAETIAITVPHGVAAGSRMKATLPDGRSFMITVPAGATAGMTLMVKVPRGLVEEPTATVPPADEPEPEVAMVRQGSMSAMHADTSELSSCFACCCIILSCYTVFPECLGCYTKGEVIQRRTVDRRRLRSTVVCLIMSAAINICLSRPLGHMHAR